MKFSQSLLATAFLVGTIGISLPVKANTSLDTPLQIAETPAPKTDMTVRSANEIAIQITDGEFHYHGVLKKTSGSTFIGEDRQIRVTYDKATSNVLVINKRTGAEYYNYFFSTTDEGSL